MKDIRLSSSGRLAVRTAARLATGFTFALMGWDTFREPGIRVELAADTLAAMRRVAPLPGDDALVVRANGAVQGVSGALLMLGVLPRLSALTMATSLVPTTLAGHSYWQADDPAFRKQQLIQFCKNISMLGGLLYALAHE
ncbi:MULTISPECIES: DoxX family protein [Mycolicibacterium]|uniref:DoxX protein n=1 Tax=Mycolicibacterium senegalense TaxID=1796 RepID=A0A378W8D3_9MYCO|nr:MULTISPECIES: DoxX family protein [Mycolicibacterium]MCV7336087.1 DoxX family protein [Mycolicibacterium senegalense]MDR7287906.1 putative membrane protein YphA (DoxX/SURF4 family) [Mycolicibacterium senegalense]QZA24910.1 DoxX family protein [Mycolicibacterium senegalense]CDP86687.1 DoxX subfamily protein [Mycolicibacterium farcinogenes]SUA28518.1 DoxX protein [Mycolicibacterium senegalense]